MDTQTFLKTILPESGFSYLAQWHIKPAHPKGGVFIHRAFSDIDELADAIIQLDREGKTVYHACASYAEVKYKTQQITDKHNGGTKAFTYTVGRTQDNAKAAKALWLDFDVGKSASHSYNSKNEAGSALKALVKEVGLPPPMIVDSGNGIHAYFLLDKAITKTEWRPLAGLFRQVCTTAGIKYDPSRDTDIASILRPPGTHNRKDPSNPKPVRVRIEGTPLPASEFESRFRTYLEANNVPLMPTAMYAGIEFSNDLSCAREYPPSSMERIAEHCQQINFFRETGGDNEAQWYAVAGIAKHCTDGEEKFLEWGAKYAGFDEAESRAKLEQWAFGPSTCEKFKAVCSEHCEHCAHKCSSPIQLGYTAPETTQEYVPPQVEAEVEAATVALEEKFGPGSQYWPAGYEVRNHKVIGFYRDDAGVDHPHEVADPPFWIIDGACDTDGSMYVIQTIIRGETKEFVIQSKDLVDLKALRSVLATNRIFAGNTAKAGVLLMSLMTQQASAFRERRKEIATFQQMGWNETLDGYLIGNRFITATEDREVRVGGSVVATTKGNAPHVKGTLAEWTAGVTKLYGGEGHLAQQYVIATVFGSVLCKLLNHADWHGIPLVLYSSKSGYGKTTVCGIGVNAFMDYSRLEISDATYNGYMATLEASGSFAAFFDEITGKLQTEQLKDFLYGAANGKRKQRANREGNLSAVNKKTWDCMSLATTNSSVIFKLTESRTDPEAATMRALEIDLAKGTRKPNKHDSESTQLADHLKANVYGVAAVPFVRTVIKNREKIEDRLTVEYQRVIDGIRTDDMKGRYYARHAACALTAAAIGAKMGILPFNATELRTWIIGHINDQIGESEQLRRSSEDLLSDMLSDLHGRILVTTRFDSLTGHNKVEESRVKVGREIAGRYATGCPGTKETVADPGKLLISVAAIREWCKANNICANETRKAWALDGLTVIREGNSKDGSRMDRIGKGIPDVVVGTVRCIEFDVHKLNGSLKETLGPGAEVIHLPTGNNPPMTGQQEGTA